MDKLCINCKHWHAIKQYKFVNGIQQFCDIFESCDCTLLGDLSILETGNSCEVCGADTWGFGEILVSCSFSCILHEPCSEEMLEWRLNDESKS